MQKFNQYDIRVFLAYPDIETDKIELINSNGQIEVLHSGNGQLNSFDCSQFPNGLYFLRIQIGNEYITKKIIVQH